MVVRGFAMRLRGSQDEKGHQKRRRGEDTQNSYVIQEGLKALSRKFLQTLTMGQTVRREEDRQADDSWEKTELKL